KELQRASYLIVGDIPLRQRGDATEVAVDAEQLGGNSLRSFCVAGLQVGVKHRPQSIRVRIQIRNLPQVFYRGRAVAALGRNLTPKQDRLLVVGIQSQDACERFIGLIIHAPLIESFGGRVVDVARLGLLPQLHVQIGQLGLRDGVFRI